MLFRERCYASVDMLMPMRAREATMNPAFSHSLPALTLTPGSCPARPLICHGHIYARYFRYGDAACAGVSAAAMPAYMEFFSCAICCHAFRRRCFAPLLSPAQRYAMMPMLRFFSVYYAVVFHAIFTPFKRRRCARVARCQQCA